MEEGDNGISHFYTEPSIYRAAAHLQRAEAAMRSTDYVVAAHQLAQATNIADLSAGVGAELRPLAARLAWLRGMLAYNRGQLSEAQRSLLLAESNALAAGLSDDLLTNILKALGNTAYLKGEMDAALDYYQRANELATRLGAHDLAALLLVNSGGVYLSRGDIAQAMDCYERGLTRAELSGDAATRCQCYGVLALICSSYISFPRALRYAAFASELVSDLRSSRLRYLVLTDLGIVYLRANRLSWAASCLLTAHHLAQRGGDRVAEAVASISLAELRQRQGAAADGYRYARFAFSVSTDVPSIRSRAALAYARALAARSTAAAEREQLIERMKVQLASEKGEEAAFLQRGLATLHAAAGEREAAAAAYQAAIIVAAPTPYQQAVTLEEYATLLQELGERQTAIRALEQAASLYRRLSLQASLDNIEIMLTA